MYVAMWQPSLHCPHRQLILLLELYSPRDVYDYLRPIALNLCADKVSSVRWISYKLVRCHRISECPMAPRAGPKQVPLPPSAPRRSARW